MREHFDSSNTTLACVRSIGKAIFVDEVTVEPASVCSAFSYVLSVLDNVVVWHGKGSSAIERQAALSYARDVAVRRH